MKFVEKEPTIVDCKVKNPHKYPVKWYKNGKELEPSDNITIMHDNEDGKEKVCFKSLTFADEGNYTCEVGGIETSGALTVTEGNIMSIDSSILWIFIIKYCR